LGIITKKSRFIGAYAKGSPPSAWYIFMPGKEIKGLEGLEYEKKSPHRAIS